MVKKKAISVFKNRAYYCPESLLGKPSRIAHVAYQKRLANPACSVLISQDLHLLGERQRKLLWRPLRLPALAPDALPAAGLGSLPPVLGHPTSVLPIAGAGTCCQSSVRSWRVWSKLSRGNGMGEPFFFFFPPPLIYKAFGSFSVIKMPLWDTR